MEQPFVIKVDPSEFGLKRARKEADKAKRKGKKVAFDLRHIKDIELKKEIIKILAGIKN
jgi:hypothetical protein